MIKINGLWIHTKEEKKKISEKNLGKVMSDQTKLKLHIKWLETKKERINIFRLGFKEHPERRQKIKAYMLSDKNPMHKAEVRRNHLIAVNKLEHKKLRSEIFKKVSERPEIKKRFLGSNNPRFGKHCTEQTKKKISLAVSGEKHYLFGQSIPKETRKKMRIATLNYIKRVEGFICPMVGKHETQILNELETLYNFKIKRNYHIKELGYWLDGYIAELNLAIEVDEPHHFINGELTERDKSRQKEIEDFLHCQFLRIKDSHIEPILIPMNLARIC